MVILPFVSIYVTCKVSYFAATTKETIKTRLIYGHNKKKQITEREKQTKNEKKKKMPTTKTRVHRHHA